MLRSIISKIYTGWSVLLILGAFVFACAYAFLFDGKSLTTALSTYSDALAISLALVGLMWIDDTRTQLRKYAERDSYVELLRGLDLVLKSDLAVDSPEMYELMAEVGVTGAIQYCGSSATQESAGTEQASENDSANALSVEGQCREIYATWVSLVEKHTGQGVTTLKGLLMQLNTLRALIKRQIKQV